MFKIAIVEDEHDAAMALSEFLARYGKENGCEIQATEFSSALQFETSKQSFDLVFMDIQMPGINGMEAAQLMRTYDGETPIIFVTNLAKYAVRGYEVDALDFIVKPVTYGNFRMRMDKAVRHIRRNAGRSIVLNTRSGIRVLSLEEIEYVEVRQHDLYYHLVGKEQPLEIYGSLSAFEQEVAGGPFVRISNSCLINMNHVRQVRGCDCVTSNGDTLPISRSKKRETVDTITAFLSGSI
ncbi:LytTR family DNA-binding domain-containing protein [Paratractidigestivibacter sp.]|uniref:LytR/AlgR family response regulator transcription factor n=1 Tax=Paratractidigestivibacter sp. TaxID=2847316 RepID=UPI002AC99F48|nr:LytTR family DNA-binding domain-containing protein [Paratractidigestivibacter sp.]